MSCVCRIFCNSRRDFQFQRETPAALCCLNIEFSRPTALAPAMKYRVQCATYNGHLSPNSAATPGANVAAWLGPTLQRSRDGDLDAGDGDGDDNSRDAPDFFAVGFQEMIGLVRAVCSLAMISLAR